MIVDSKNTPVNPKLWAKCQAEAKRKYRVHPSAYSNGYASKIYKERGGTWRSDSLKTWFNEDWKAINSSGTIVGECGSGATKGKVKCLPASKARSLSKKDRSALAKRKQSQDPNPNREGSPVMVSSKKRGDSMTPERFARAIVSIEQKHGLRLDAQDTWLRFDSWRRLGPNQRGKPCGRGWVGLRGACKRGKKSDDNTEKIKASKVELADKIRAKKGMRDRNAAKPVAQKGMTVTEKQALEFQALVNEGAKNETIAKNEPIIKDLDWAVQAPTKGSHASIAPGLLLESIRKIEPDLKKAQAYINKPFVDDSDPVEGDGKDPDFITIRGLGAVRLAHQLAIRGENRVLSIGRDGRPVTGYVAHDSRLQVYVPNGIIKVDQKGAINIARARKAIDDAVETHSKARKESRKESSK